MLGGMSNSARILALGLFLLAAVGFLYVARTEAPPEELSVLRALLIEWDSTEIESLPDPLGQAVLVSSPSTCFLDERPAIASLELFDAFLHANEERAKPIRLSSLTDLVAVVSFDDARLWQGNIHLMDVGDRNLVALSRVGMSNDQALFCVNGGRLGMLYLFERSGGQWKLAASEQSWIA